MRIALASLMAFSFVYCLLNWRRGLFLCIAAGFLQDPIRKIWPGRPVAFVVLVAVYFLTCLVGSFLQGERLGISRLFRWFPAVKVPAILFTLVVAIQTGATLVRTSNIVIAGIGVLGYLSPIVAVLLGERFADNRVQLLAWLKVYLAGSLVVAASILLQFAGLASPLFDSIGLDEVYGIGGLVAMLPGIMRSSEIAAWHVAAGCCLVFAASLAASKRNRQAIGGAILVALVVALLLTGRRKMLAELTLFGLVFAYLATHLRRVSSRLFRSLTTAAVVLFFFTQIVAAPGTENRIVPYLGRGVSVVQESGDRLLGMTIRQFGYVIDRNGVFGSGAGTGAQGTQYFGGGEEIVGGAAEGGMGRVLAELGLPGLTISVWLAVALWRSLWKIAKAAQKLPPEIAVLTHGLIAFLPANAAVFLTAHQVFGDPFVLIVLGWITGSVLAIPRIVLQAEADAWAKSSRADATSEADAVAAPVGAA
ncbi:MAG: hypothetical protein U0X73_07270 [Thermoanaerobaculia bacterium]